MTLEERLNRKLAKKDQCLVWTGARTTQGYGLIGNGFGKKILLTHRAAYELSTGISPVGKVVRHTCDNPPCCNPDHLLLGTQLDNRNDMLERKRDNVARGERQACAKLTEESVLKIRQQYACGSVTITTLAEDFGVARRTAGDVIHRKTWQHI